MRTACIFCDGHGKKSKEHIWPVWMHKHLKVNGDGNHTSEAHTYENKKHLGSEKTERQGDLTTKKLRVVCQQCNSGWMSFLESSVKPIMIRMLALEAMVLKPVEQELLARWFTMKAIVGEYASKGLNSTPTVDRVAFKNNNTIPAYFAVYIGTHNEEADSAWLRSSNTLSRSPAALSLPLEGVSRNTQSIAFICGALFIYVFAVRVEGLMPVDILKLPQLTRIFPMQSNIVIWPPKNTLTSIDMGRIAYALDDMLNLENVKYGGDLT